MLRKDTSTLDSAPVRDNFELCPGSVSWSKRIEWTGFPFDRDICMFRTIRSIRYLLLHLLYVFVGEEHQSLENEIYVFVVLTSLHTCCYINNLPGASYYSAKITSSYTLLTVNFSFISNANRDIVVSLKIYLRPIMWTKHKALFIRFIP